jgi:1-acyl-sn-glycerol-3-phosphate acyltransferase
MPSASLAFLPPRLDGRVLGAARLLLPLWLRRAGLRPQPVQGLERLQGAMERFQAGRSRLLLAFRHPSLDDPAVMAHLLWRNLGRSGRFRPHPHAQFLYDRGIPLWAGEGTSWLLSRLGGCSIQRGTLDLPALRTARALLLDGPHPFAAAPEGATNGHNEVVSALEPGVAQLAFWTADDLAKAGRPEATELLPIGLQYSFRGSVWPAIEALLAQLERDAGLPPDPGHRLDPERLYERLIALAERMLSLLERFYREAYHRDLPGAPAGTGETGAGAGEASAGIDARLPRLLDAALMVAEEPLGVKARGDLPDRCRRIEQASWERLYPPVNGQAEATVLERGLAARLAEETARRMWHMRMVEAFVAVSGRYVRDCPSQERFADTLLLLWDTQCRIRGGDPGQRPRLGQRCARITIGEPLLVNTRLAEYRADRRGAVASLTAELQQRLEALIVPSG